MQLFKRFESTSNKDIEIGEYILYATDNMNNGVSDEETRLVLFEAIKKSNKYLSQVVINKFIDNIFKCAKSGLSPIGSEIKFCKAELDYIQSFNNIDIESILFILFCLYKYYGSEFSFKDRALFTEAHVTYKAKEKLSKVVSLDKAKTPFYTLENATGIKYKVSDFAKELYDPSNIIIEIDNTRNIVYYYYDYIGKDSYYFCENCGSIEKRMSNRNKYCKICLRDIQNEQKRKSKSCTRRTLET